MTTTFGTMLDFIAAPEPEPQFRVCRSDGGPVQCVRHWESPEMLAHLLRASGWAREGQVKIFLERHAILRYTPCGAWIDTYGGERFVNLRAGKQWASATEAEAIDQLYYRKRAQVRILASRLAEAEEVQAAMEKHLGKKPPPARAYSRGYEDDGGYW